MKSRSYKKAMNDSSREEWIKIMKNENISFLINEIWTLINSLRNRRMFRDKWVYKIKKEEHDEILRYKTRWVIREFEQIERLNYTKIILSMIKSMNYKTMCVIIVVNDWEIEQMNVKTTFLYDKILENVYVVQLTNFEKNVNQICKLNKALYDLKQSSRIWFETLIKFLFFELCFVKRRIQRFYERRHHDHHLCERFDFYKIQFRDNFLTEECFEQTLRNERFKLVHLLSSHDDLQKLKSQTNNSESKCLRWTNVTKSWNVRLQIINHFHERLVSFDKNYWWVYCWQKSQNQLSINREIIHVHHVKNSIEHSLFYLDDQSLCLQFHSNSLTSSQTHLSLFTRNTLNETDVSRNIKIFRELHELKLNRKSRYQTINFKIRV